MLILDGGQVAGPVWIPSDPPSLANYLAPTLQPVPLLPAIAALMLLLYLTGAARLWMNGRRWPVLPTISFTVGCLALGVITGAGVEGYGFEMFSVFMFQQLTLMMAVPPLLVLGRPGTLLLRATPHRGLGRVVLVGARRFLRSRAARVAIHPGFMLPLFLLAFYGLYLSDAADVLLRSWAGHTALEVAFLVSGVLFTVPVLSQDPLPTPQSHAARAVDLAAEMPLHAFFGVIIMMSPNAFVPFFSSPPPAWNVDPIDDQWTAGALAWSYGEAPALLMLLLIMSRWQRSDAKASRARDKAVDRDGDAELDAYNSYLASLDRQEEVKPMAWRRER